MVHLPSSCNSTLFTANQRNVDILRSFVKNERTTHTISNHTAAFETAYDLLIADKRQDSVRHQTPRHLLEKRTINTIVLLTGAQLEGSDRIQLENLFRQKESELNSTVYHLVYTLGLPDIHIKDEASQILASIVKQDFNKTWNYTEVTGLTFIQPNTSTEEVQLTVAQYYKKFPPSLASNYTIISPLIDNTTGLTVLVTLPIRETRNSTGDKYGVAALELSMTTLFADVTDFSVGVHSYAFLIKRSNGQVLLHPKLRNPSVYRSQDSVFPTVDILELELADKTDELRTVNDIRKELHIKLRPGRSTFLAATEEQLPRQDAELHYAHILGTPFTLAVVIFVSDQQKIVYKEIPEEEKESISGTAVYHKIEYHQPVSQCKLKDVYVATEKSTIKLAPSVFAHPERYKYGRETQSSYNNITGFIRRGINKDLFKSAQVDDLLYSLRATKNIPTLWKKSRQPAVERFIGSPTGFFRIYPGVSMQNTYSHYEEQWYKKSVARPGNLIVTEGVAHSMGGEKAVILSKAVSEDITTNTTQVVRKLLGVAGAAVTYRTFIAMLYNSVKECNGTRYECHIMDDRGYLINSKQIAGNQQHLIEVFPWLAKKLLSENKLKKKWCTSMSEGKHKLFYVPSVTFEASDSNNTDVCQQYAVSQVDRTNIFVIILVNGFIKKCPDNPQTCVAIGNYTQCSRTCLIQDSECESPCQCSADFDQCSSQFHRKNNFPYEACPYDETLPFVHQFADTSPQKPVKQCDLPCVMRLKESACSERENCKWRSENTLPTCEAEDVAPTTTLVLPTHRSPTPKKRSSSFRIPTLSPRSPTPSTPLHTEQRTSDTTNSLSRISTELSRTLSSSVNTDQQETSPAGSASSKITSLPSLSSFMSSRRSSPTTSLSGSTVYASGSFDRSGGDYTGVIVGVTVGVLFALGLIGYAFFKLNKGNCFTRNKYREQITFENITYNASTGETNLT